MNKLPCETIIEIFSHIEDKCDIASFRCIQRTFAKIGRPFLFGEISIQPTSFSLHALLKISHRRSLATYVKSITLHINHISETVLDSYKRTIEKPTPRVSLGTSAQEEMQYRLKLFNFGASALYDFQKSPDMGSLLIAALAHLPNLKAVNFADGPERLSPINSIRQTNDQTLPGLVPHLPGFTGSAPDMSFWGEQYSFRCFKALIDAAYFNKKRLSSFKAKVLIYSAPFQGEIYNPHIMVRMPNVLQSCREIELTFFTERGGRDNIPDQLKNNLFTVLLTVKKLKKLTLKFGIEMKWADVRAPFSVIFGDIHTWLSLEELTIAGFGINDNELLEFLKRHRATLRKLSITNCELYTSLWCAVVKMIKETHQLTSFEIGLELRDCGNIYTAEKIQKELNPLRWKMDTAILM